MGGATAGAGGAAASAAAASGPRPASSGGLGGGGGGVGAGAGAGLQDAGGPSSSSQGLVFSLDPCITYASLVWFLDVLCFGSAQARAELVWTLLESPRADRRNATDAAEVSECADVVR